MSPFPELVGETRDSTAHLKPQTKDQKSHPGVLVSGVGSTPRRVTVRSCNPTFHVTARGRLLGPVIRRSSFAGKILRESPSGLVRFHVGSEERVDTRLIAGAF